MIYCVDVMSFHVAYILELWSPNQNNDLRLTHLEKPDVKQ